MPDTQTWYTELSSGEAYAGRCCATFDADCGPAYDSSKTNNLASGWKASHLHFTSVDLAITACPQKKDVCIYPSVTQNDGFCSKYYNSCMCETGRIDLRRKDAVAKYGEMSPGPDENYFTIAETDPQY